MNVRTRAILTTILCCTPLYSVKAETPLFPSDPSAASRLEVNLKVNLKKLMSSAEAEEAGEFQLMDGSTNPIFSVKVSPRGKSRQERCAFFPLWLNFKRSEVKDTLLKDQNKLKLVTHCRGSYSKRGYVAAEMLVYRLLNLIDERSFRVRAVRMTYTNTHNQKEMTHPAFLIEHKKSLSARLAGTPYTEGKVRLSNVDSSYATRIALFQYMIGNTDFSLVQGPDPAECCHNTVPLKVGDRDQLRVVSIPYDFDVTGFVNVPYATPPANLPIKRLSQRLFRGYCAHNDMLKAEIERILGLETKILETIENFTDLENRDAKKQLRYATAFFKTLKDPRQQQRALMNKCRS